MLVTLAEAVTRQVGVAGDVCALPIHDKVWFWDALRYCAQSEQTTNELAIQPPPAALKL
jgi:hypothetical protein